MTTYNPASVPVELQSFKVPPSSTDAYDVSVFDATSEAWQQVESTLLCYTFLENNVEQSSYEDCNLHVKAESRPHHMTFMKVQRAAAPSEPKASETS